MIRLESKRYFEDMMWAEEHMAELAEKYPNMWVAIYEKRVVGAGRSISEAEAQATEETGIDSMEIPVVFVEGEVRIYAH